MRHLGSALVLGVLLAIILVLVSWERPPQLGGCQAKALSIVPSISWI